MVAALRIPQSCPVSPHVTNARTFWARDMHMSQSFTNRPSRKDLRSGMMVNVVVRDNWTKAETIQKGVIVDLLSKQFTYEDANGHVRFAFYDDEFTICPE